MWRMVGLGADTDFFGEPYQIGNRVRAHLLHDATTMNLDGLLAGPEFLTDLLVQHSRHD